MSTVDTVKAQLQSLITKAKNVTGNSASDLTSQVDALIAGYGSGTDTSDATSSESDILYPKTAYSKGKKITGNIQSQAAQTITPGTSDITIPSGKYLSGVQTIKGDANLISENIKNGKSIFGVQGSYQGSGGVSEQYSETFTVDSDISGTASTKVISRNSFIKEHINDDSLFVVLVRKSTTSSDGTIIYLSAASNSPFMIGGYFVTIYRTSYSTGVQTTTSTSYKLNSATSGGYARIHADSNGDVYVHTYSQSSGWNSTTINLKAGTYTLLYGLLG